MIHHAAHTRRLACLTICTAVLSYASSCHSTEPRIVFGTEGRTISLGPLTAPSTAPLRALRHPGATTRIAMGGLDLGLTLLDRAGDMVEMFDGENVVEIDRDPAAPELLVAFLEEGSRFEILRNGAATTRPSSRYVVDFLLADHDGNGTTDLIGLSEGGEVFVVPSYAEVMDFDAVATPIGAVGAVREQPGTDRPRRIDVGDFDGDGGADVVIGLGDQGVVIILSSGEEITSVAVSAASVIRAELDGEPGDEIVTYGNRRYNALRWNDDGLVIYGGESENADGMDVADVTGDGRDDVLLLFSDSGPVMLAASTDDGLAPPNLRNQIVDSPVEDAILRVPPYRPRARLVTAMSVGEWTSLLPVADHSGYPCAIMDTSGDRRTTFLSTTAVPLADMASSIDGLLAPTHVEIKLEDSTHPRGVVLVGEINLVWRHP